MPRTLLSGGAVLDVRTGRDKWRRCRYRRRRQRRLRRPSRPLWPGNWCPARRMGPRENT